MPHTPPAPRIPTRRPARIDPRLAVALEANAAAYRRAVLSGAPGECWDFVVLTAANEKQAEGHRRELALRHRDVRPAGAFLPAAQRSVVVPDPPGKRAGSGGATLGVLAALARDHGVAAADLARLRILLIHSGGASQRLPAYSPLGKIFAPLPLLRPDGQIATLFDHLYLTLAGLPERLGPGVLMLAGDVMLLFDHRHVAAPTAGVTAISMRVEPEAALGHGVYVTDPTGHVLQTLQKVPAEVMRQRGATDANGKVLIDTGLLFFDGAAAGRLMGLAGAGGKRRRDGAGGRRGREAASGLQDAFAGQIDLYEDVTAALAAGTDRAIYLAAGAARAMRQNLWRSLHGLPFHAAHVDGEFVHLGTTRQFRDAMIGRSPSPAAELFQADVLTHNEWDTHAGNGRVYHSVLLADGASRGRLGAGAVVEHSILGPRSAVGAGSVVSQTVAVERPLRLGDEQLFFQCPVREPSGRARYVQVLCGVEDDFKGRFDEGRCHYLNRPLADWLDGHGIAPDEIWPGVPDDGRTLWTARLFVGTPERDRADAALPPACPSTPSGRRAVAAWRRSPRCSMAMLLDQADAAALIAHREVIAAHLQAEALLRSIRAGEDRPVEAVIARYATAAAYEQCEGMLERWASAPTADAAHAVTQARVAWCVAQLLQRPDHPDAAAARGRAEPAMRRAFERVARASEIGSRAVGGGAFRDSPRAEASEIRKPFEDVPHGSQASPLVLLARIKPPAPVIAAGGSPRVGKRVSTRGLPPAAIKEKRASSAQDAVNEAEVVSPPTSQPTQRSGAPHANPFAIQPTAREIATVAPPPAWTVADAPVTLSPGVEVTATAPVRLDLAGGWSDTPPYCFERGGHVVNVAINLDGRPPLSAVVRTIREPKLILESRDLGRRVELHRVGAAGPDLGDPFSLHKVALGITGLLPPRGDVAAHLRTLGAGLHVVTESRLPKGSGLGTSSILAAALLAALFKLRGRKPSVAALIEYTSLLEQRLSTGGGWQDQVGGIVGGVKSTVTAPGVPQRPVIEALEMDDARYAGLEQRLVVYYSGRQRLARDILRRVMGRWLAREPAVVLLTDALKRSAQTLRGALLRGRWGPAAAEMAQYWQIKKSLFAGSTTPSIDLLFLEMRADYLAAGLAGAGGGGFAYFMCRDAGQAGRLRARLADHAARPGSLGGLYAAQVNRRGLVVTTRTLR